MSDVKLLDIPGGDLHWYLRYFKGACKLFTVGYLIESPKITVKIHDENYDWCLQLYPKGITELDMNYLSIYVKMCSDGTSLIRAECKCTIVYSKTKRMLYSCINNFTQAGERFDCVKIRMIDLIENLKEQDFNILVSIRVWFCENLVKELWITSNVEISQDTDVIIKVDDKIFNVHQNVLIAQSPVFAAMFRHNTKENEENYIEIVDIDSLVVKQVISFMYSGTVENLDSLAEELLYAAEKYGIVGLKNVCESYYLKNLTIDNVIDIVNIADYYSATKLKEKAMYFLVLHIKDLIDTEGYKMMAKSQPLILDHIIRLTILLNASNIKEKLILPCQTTNVFDSIKGVHNVPSKSHSVKFANQ